jgi:hypothetical protein
VAIVHFRTCIPVKWRVLNLWTGVTKPYELISSENYKLMVVCCLINYLSCQYLLNSCLNQYLFSWTQLLKNFLLLETLESSSPSLQKPCIIYCVELSFPSELKAQLIVVNLILLSKQYKVTCTNYEVSEDWGIMFLWNVASHLHVHTAVQLSTGKYSKTYSRGPGFKSRPGDRLSQPRFVVDFLSPSRKILW